jgi:hypothetical protein
MRLERFLKIGLIIFLFTGFFIEYQHRSPKRRYSDFHMLYHTGKRFLNGEAIYTFKGNISYYKYTPFYAFFIAPLAVFSERTAASIWFVMNVIFFLALLYCIKELVIKDKEHFQAYTLFYTLTVISCLRFIIGNFHQGQSNIFMISLLFMGLYFMNKKRENISAFFIAFSILVKYMPVLFLPWLIIKKRYKLVVKIFVFIIILSLLPVIKTGWNDFINLNKEWISFLFPSSLDNYSTTCFPNQSLLACLNRFLSRDSIYSINFAHLTRGTVYLIFYMLALILYLVSIIPGRNKRYFMYDISLISICAGLFNPNAWKNFFIWILPAYATVIFYLMEKKSKDKMVLILGIISFALCTLTAEDLVKGFAGDYFEIYSSITIGALLLFLALTKIKFTGEKYGI